VEKQEHPGAVADCSVHLVLFWPLYAVRWLTLVWICIPTIIIWYVPGPVCAY
jgi:hypothetical protein